MYRLPLIGTWFFTWYGWWYIRSDLHSSDSSDIDSDLDTGEPQQKRHKTWYRHMRNEELKRLCRERNLYRSTNKKVVIQRVQLHDNNGEWFDLVITPCDFYQNQWNAPIVIFRCYILTIQSQNVNSTWGTQFKQIVIL